MKIEEQLPEWHMQVDWNENGTCKSLLGEEGNVQWQISSFIDRWKSQAKGIEQRS